MAFSYTDYTEPPWAVPPKENSWSLLEFKGGVEVATHKLIKAFTLLGRASDDISLAHESCSRWHARISFDNRGIPWLRDLASAHGTTVNRKNLPAAAIGKVESESRKAGSRGVMLYPGDVIQFGASTRMYCLEGPPEYERGAVRKIDLPTKVVAEPASAEATPTVEKAEGVSWGMDMDDDPSHEISEGTRSLPTQLDSSMIPDKHLKAWERLTAKKYKLQNVLQENERIRAKGELSQGQESQLRKNGERMKKWQEEIEEMEHELYEKLFPEKKIAATRKRHHPVEQDDDDIDDYAFYDRTKDSTDDLFDEGETQNSLTIKWKTLQTEWKQCTGVLAGDETKVEQLAQRMKFSDPNDDDAFFLQNDLVLAKDSLKKAQERKESILYNLKETERLLRIVNDNLEIDRETGFIGEKKSAPDTIHVALPDAAIMPPPPSQSSPRASMPPPPRIASSPETTMSPPRLASFPEASMPPPPRLPPSVDDTMLPPPPKRTRGLGPTVPSSTTFDRTDMPPPLPPAKRPSAPMGTLSVLTSGKDTERKQKDTKASESFDPKKDVWKVPDDQDGSGITKLNAKFAGRY